ncbi:transcriptional regulator [Enterobacter bugandensis]|uniref:winged helix-turn-helix domain-containing protein n=1 Tax=Enterobacter bugandensis TaxID=881260 RepID=UPI0030842292
MSYGKVNMLWIINDNIQFNPETKKLESLRNPDLTITLTTPASRCLTLLLESYPEVVTQKSFFSFVWAEEGMLVPANTLYQNISIVRRGLRATGETDELLILTVPRKGFQIEKRVKVQKLTKGIDIFESQKNDAFHSLSASPSLTPPLNKDIKKANSNKTKNKPIQINTYLLMVISFVLGIMLLQFPWFYDTSKMDYFNSYTLSKVENGCHYFSKDDNIDDIDIFSKYKSMIMKTGLDCKKYPWIYFASFSAAPAFSAFVCKEPYGSSSQSNCITLYFRGYNQ